MRRCAWLLPLIALVLAGCSTTVDTNKGERLITKRIERGLGAKVKSVKCPADVKAKKGDTFDCAVAGEDGTTGVVTVVQTDAKGNVTFKMPFVSNTKGEAFIAKAVKAQVGSLIREIDCPEIIPFKEGGTYDCKAVGQDGTTGTVAVTQTSGRGDVHIDAPFVHVRNLERLISTNLGQQIGADDVQVTCPEIVVGKKGDQFDCHATSGTDKATLKVTQKDDQGNVNYKLEQQ